MQEQFLSGMKHCLELATPILSSSHGPSCKQDDSRIGDYPAQAGTKLCGRLLPTSLMYSLPVLSGGSMSHLSVAVAC
ncbi:hypothetical protein BV898_19659 [Hypsibius exemplaris]|uniref:Uncharacterized protein n=1 Tax=Hypsibius exemplaris TaxID=2072580 RepID=A0A9X6NLV9_HYPEX|nr:hypothetical protein BV898_19659 [Hypsibius exemplaris]